MRRGRPERVRGLDIPLGLGRPGGQLAGLRSVEARWWPRTLQTDRLILRPVSVDDRAWLVGLRTDPELRRYLAGARSAEEAERDVPVGIRADQPVLVVVDETGQQVGTIDFSQDRGELEVSYVFVRSSWGQGLASEALPVLLRWAAAAFAVGSVIAVTQAANERSLRLLGRTGFVEERRFVEYDADQVLLRWTASER